MEITSTYTNHQQKKNTCKNKNTMISLFPSLISDIFSVEELDEFKYTSEST